MINIPFDANDNFDCLATTDFAPICKLPKVITHVLMPEWRSSARLYTFWERILSG